MATPSTPNGIFSNPAVASATDEDLWGGILNSNFNIADAGYTTRTHNLNCADYEISRPKMKDFGEVSATASSTAGAITLDFTTSQHFRTTLTENITSVTLSSPSPSNTIAGYVWLVTQDGTGGRTITFPASVVWAGGTPPVITSTAGRTDRIVLLWDAQAAKYLASIAQNYTL